MKKLMFIAVVLAGVALAPKARAVVSFGISIGDGYGYRDQPRYQPVTPYYPRPAPVYVVPQNSCEVPRYYRHPSHRWVERWHRFHR